MDLGKLKNKDVLELYQITSNAYDEHSKTYVITNDGFAMDDAMHQLASRRKKLFDAKMKVLKELEERALKVIEP